MSLESPAEPKQEKFTVSELFMQAAKRLKTDFDYLRQTNPHSATKGSEVEKTLRLFLNNHLPQRFRATTGIVIDTKNKLSKQTDIIIYDALSSPVYRYSEDAMILPVDNVASVVEVKSRLTSDELSDAYAKIASVKSLVKRPSSGMDLKATGSDLKMSATFGAIFAFTSDIAIETAAERMEVLNKQYDWRLWPDILIILDVGAVNYGMQFPGSAKIGDLMPREEDFAIIPCYVQMVMRKHGEFSLNHFFILLLSHLQFFPHRPSTPPLDIVLSGAAKEGICVTSYQYDRDKKLRSASESEIQLPATITIKDSSGANLSRLTWMAWPSGGVVASEGAIPLSVILAMVGLAKDEQVFNWEGRTFSSVLPTSRSEFLGWGKIINSKMKGAVAEPEVPQMKPAFDEGTSTPFIARMTLQVMDLARRVLSEELLKKFEEDYPLHPLLSFRKQYRAIAASEMLPEELVQLFLANAHQVTAGAARALKQLGLNVAYLPYRDPAYEKGLALQTNGEVRAYLSRHRESWAKKLSAYLELSSDAKRSEFCRKLSKSDLVAMYNGVATFIEEMTIFAFQLNARAGLRIREVARADRKLDVAVRFVTDLTRSWSLTYSELPFDEL